MVSSNKKLTVFGYVRVSTENQIENYSIDEQTQRIKAYCKAKGWVLAKIYTDGGFSGGNTNRPALNQMLSETRLKAVDAVVVYKLDRLSRSQKDTLILIEDEFLKQNVDFISIAENFDTSTPFGKAMIGILSVFAQLEKDQITERFTMGRIGRGKAGYFHGGGNAPFGYDYTNGELIINELEAVGVRNVFDLFIKGKSINAISIEMGRKFNSSWSSAKTSNIIRNSIYIGKIKFSKSEYDGRHAPIISSEIFAEANMLLSSAERENKKNVAQKTPYRAVFLLSSLLKCSKCGAKYAGNHGFYKCYSRSKSNKKYITDPNCKNQNWNISELDDKVVKHVEQVLSNKKSFNEILSSSCNATEEIINIKAINKRIKDIDSQIGRLIDLYQVDSVSIDILSNRLKSLNLEKDVLKAQIASGSRATSASPKKEAFINNAERFRKNFFSSEIETKRLLISSLIQSILITEDDIKIIWRI